MYKCLRNQRLNCDPASDEGVDSGGTYRNIVRDQVPAEAVLGPRKSISWIQICHLLASMSQNHKKLSPKVHVVDTLLCNKGVPITYLYTDTNTHRISTRPSHLLNTRQILLDFKKISHDSYPSSISQHFPIIACMTDESGTFQLLDELSLSQAVDSLSFTTQALSPYKYPRGCPINILKGKSTNNKCASNNQTPHCNYRHEYRLDSQASPQERHIRLNIASTVTGSDKSSTILSKVRVINEKISNTARTIINIVESHLHCRVIQMNAEFVQEGEDLMWLVRVCDCYVSSEPRDKVQSTKISHGIATHMDEAHLKRVEANNLISINIEQNHYSTRKEDEKSFGNGKPSKQSKSQYNQRSMTHLSGDMFSNSTLMNKKKQLEKKKLDQHSLINLTKDTKSQILGSTQLESMCHGDFCRYDIQRYQSAPKDLNSSSVDKKFHLHQNQSKSDVSVAFTNFCDRLINEECEEKRIQDLALENENVQNDRNDERLRCGQDFMYDLPRRVIIQARKEKHIVDIFLRQHDGRGIKTTDYDYKFSAHSDDLMLGSTFPGHYYMTVKVCQNCYFIYNLVEHARSKIKCKRDAKRLANANDYNESKIRDIVRERAVAAMKCVQVTDLVEIRSFINPSPAIQMTVSALMVALQGKSVEWNESRPFLSNCSHIFNKINECDLQNISDESIEELETYIRNPLFRPEILIKMSLAAAKVCAWIIGFVHIYKLENGIFIHERIDELSEWSSMKIKGYSPSMYQRSKANEFQKLPESEQLKKLKKTFKLKKKRKFKGEVKVFSHPSPRILLCSDGTTRLPYEVIGKSSADDSKIGFIFCHDIFDSMDVTKLLAIEIAKKNPNCQILVFNQPGQAGTTFPGKGRALIDVDETNDVPLNNDFHAEKMHELLSHLDCTGEFSISGHPFCFIGMGYGLSIALSFIDKFGQNEKFSHNLKAIISINGFASLNKQLTAIFHSSANIFSSFPESRPDLPVAYFTQFLFSDRYVERVSREIALNIYTAIANPISLIGRIRLINGCLKNRCMQSTLKQLKAPIFILQSTENRLVNPTNIDSLFDGKDVNYIWSDQLRLNASKTGNCYGKHVTKIMTTFNTINSALAIFVQSGHAIIQECKLPVVDLVTFIFRLQLEKGAEKNNKKESTYIKDYSHSRAYGYKSNDICESLSNNISSSSHILCLKQNLSPDKQEKTSLANECSIESNKPKVTQNLYQHDCHHVQSEIQTQGRGSLNDHDAEKVKLSSPFDSSAIIRKKYKRINSNADKVKSESGFSISRVKANHEFTICDKKMSENSKMSDVNNRFDPNCSSLDGVNSNIMHDDKTYEAKHDNGIQSKMLHFNKINLESNKNFDIEILNESKDLSLNNTDDFKLIDNAELLSPESNSEMKADKIEKSLVNDDVFNQSNTNITFHRAVSYSPSVQDTMSHKRSSKDAHMNNVYKKNQPYKIYMMKNDESINKGMTSSSTSNELKSKLELNPNNLKGESHDKSSNEQQSNRFSNISENVCDDDEIQSTEKCKDCNSEICVANKNTPSIICPDISENKKLNVKEGINQASTLTHISKRKKKYTANILTCREKEEASDGTQRHIPSSTQLNHFHVGIPIANTKATDRKEYCASNKIDLIDLHFKLSHTNELMPPSAKQLQLAASRELGMEINREKERILEEKRRRMNVKNPFLRQQEARRKKFDDKDEQYLAILEKNMSSRLRPAVLGDINRKIDPYLTCHDASVQKSIRYPHESLSYDESAPKCNLASTTHDIPNDLETILDKLKVDNSRAKKLGVLRLDEFERVKNCMVQQHVEQLAKIQSLKESERNKFLCEKSLIIQKLARAKLGRIRMSREKTNREIALRESRAAIKAQTLCRQYLAKIKAANLRYNEMLQIVHGTSVNIIQRIWRGHKGRMIFKQKRKLQATLLFQRLIRGYFGRRDAQHERQRLERIRSLHNFATKIQCAWRCKGALNKSKLLIFFKIASIEIQRIFRGFIQRKKVAKKRKWYNAEPGPERIKLGLDLIQKSREEFKNKRNEIDSLHSAQEKVESSINLIYKELRDSEKELDLITSEMEEIDLVEKNINNVCQNMGSVKEKNLSKHASIDQSLQNEKIERKKKKLFLESEFNQLFREIEGKREGLRKLEISIADIEATRQIKDREFDRLQRDLMELLHDQKFELEQVRAKGIELETATAASAASAEATANKARENERQTNNMFHQQEELMKFQFMSMSLSYFSSLSMLQQMRGFSSNTAANAISTSAEAAATAAATAAAANITSLSNGKGFMKSPIESAIDKRETKLKQVQEIEKMIQIPKEQLPQDCRKWTLCDVSRWLSALSLDVYVEKFKEACVDGEFLLELREEDLATVLGVEHKLHRRKIMLSREKLKPLSVKEERDQQRALHEEDAIKAREIAKIPNKDIVFSQVRHGKLMKIEGSLEYGFNIETEDEAGNTILMVAVQNNHRKIVEFLIRRGSNIQHFNKNGNTALHFAFAYDKSGLMGEFLIENGADDTVENFLGLTPYDGIGENNNT